MAAAPHRPVPVAERTPPRAQSAGAGLDQAEQLRVRAWTAAATELHERVRAACWDTLLGELLALHAPVIAGGPVCRGCDRDSSADPAPTWPCRSYEAIATQLLGLTSAEEIEPLIGAVYSRVIRRG